MQLKPLVIREKQIKTTVREIAIHLEDQLNSKWIQSHRVINTGYSCKMVSALWETAKLLFKLMHLISDHTVCQPPKWLYSQFLNTRNDLNVPSTSRHKLLPNKEQTTKRVNIMDESQSKHATHKRTHCSHIMSRPKTIQGLGDSHCVKCPHVVAHLQSWTWGPLLASPNGWAPESVQGVSKLRPARWLRLAIPGTDPHWSPECIQKWMELHNVVLWPPSTTHHAHQQINN